MNYDFERCVHEVVSTCHEANYDYDEVYDMVCDAVDDSGCSINDVDRVRVDLLMDGNADGANLLGAIITDMYIDRVIVPRIHAMMEDYEGVIIWDLPSQIRNKYLKYCFSHSIRCYMSPKISDIILLGTDRIHLFDTPLLMCRNQGLSMEQRRDFWILLFPALELLYLPRSC